MILFDQQSSVHYGCDFISEYFLASEIMFHSVHSPTSAIQYGNKTSTVPKPPSASQADEFRYPLNLDVVKMIHLQMDSNPQCHYFGSE